MTNHDPKNKECQRYICEDELCDIDHNCSCPPTIQHEEEMQGDIETCSKHYVKDCPECFVQEKQDWENDILTEYGVHFKDSPDELKWLIDDIRTLLQEAKEEGRRDRKHDCEQTHEEILGCAICASGYMSYEDLKKRIDYHSWRITDLREQLSKARLAVIAEVEEKIKRLITSLYGDTGAMTRTGRYKKTTVMRVVEDLKKIISSLKTNSK